MTSDDHEIRWTILVTLLLWLLIGLIACHGQSVRLGWDYPGTNQDVSFVLYVSTNALVDGYPVISTTNVPCGTNKTVQVSDIRSGHWWFATAARDTNGVESLLSNVIQVEAPPPPANMRTIVLQYSNTLSNFVDAGFIKVRMQ